MYYDALTGEDEKAFIEKFANYTIDKGLEDIAVLFFGSFKTLGYVGSQFGIAALSPFLILFGRDIEKMGYQSIRFFERKENVEELIKKIEELKKERIPVKHEKHKEGGKANIKSYLTKIWNSLFDKKIKPSNGY